MQEKWTWAILLQKVIYFAFNKISENLLYSAAYGLVEVPKDFASYLLGIVLINLLIYFFCYIIMKVLC